jgi:site-specific DNA recombinase
MNGVIYCRVSTKEQTEGTSLEWQKQACQEYAARKNIEISKVFVEMGESAKFADRTQLLKLIDFCKDKKNDVQVLIVWKIDRFARNVVDHFKIKSILGNSGVEIHSVTEPIDSRPEGRFMETMLAGAAQFDNDIRALRSVGGMERRVQEGIFPWMPPLGYMSANPKAKKTQPDIPDPDRFPIIKAAWQRLLSGFFTKADIARYFRDAGLTTRGGKPVTAQLIDRIFINKFYAGILINPWTREEIQGKHLAMITIEDFHQVQHLLSKRSNSQSHRFLNPDFPLKSVLRCPACKRPMTGSWCKGRHRKYAYYHCYFRSCKFHGRGIQRELPESQFNAYLRKLIPKPAAIPIIEGKIMNALAKYQARTRNQTLRQRQKLQQLEKENKELITMRSKQLISDAEFLKAHGHLNREISSLSAFISSSESHFGVAKDNVREALGFLVDLPEQLEQMPLDIRRRFQQNLFPDGLEIGGIGTAQKPLLFRVIDEFGDGKYENVASGLKVWNRFSEQFSKLSTMIKGLQAAKNIAEEKVPKKAV